jgi:mono/diheme cytochrome c family protein
MEVGRGMCMSRVATAIVIAVLFSLGTPAWAASSDDVEQGQKVYSAQKCSICHSIGGTGNKKGPLDGVGTKLTADQIRLWMTDAPGMTAKTKAARKPPMKSYMLPKEDLDALVAYMQSLKK